MDGARSQQTETDSTGSADGLLTQSITSLTTAAYVVSADRQQFAANSRARELWGFEDSRQGHTESDFALSPSDGTTLTDLIARLIAGERVVPPQMVQLHRSDGTSIRALAAVTPVLNQAGKLEGVLATFHPVAAPEKTAARFLLDAGKVLGDSLDLDESLRQLAQLLVPQLCDWCIVTLVDEHGRLTRTEVAHAEPSLTGLAEELKAQARRRDRPAEVALHSGQTQLYAHITEEALRTGAEGPEHYELMRRMGISSVLSVPLTLRGRRLGAMTLVLTHHRRQFSATDVELAGELAARVAQAIDHAELYRESQEARALAENHADRLSVLATASNLLAEAGFDFDRACRDVARLVCEHLGDACVLTVARGDDQQQLPVAVDHRNQRHLALLHDAVFKGTPGLGLGLAKGVYASAKGLRATHLQPSDLDEAIAPRPLLARYVREVGISSLLVAPLRAQGRVLGTIGITRDAGGAPYTADDERLLQDLADRAALFFEKQRHYQEAQEALQLRDTFLSVASHELRTPLSTMRIQVQGFLMQAQRRTVEVPPSVLKRFHVLDGQILRLSRLVEELLDVSRITSGRLELDREEFDLVALAREVSDRFSESLAQAGSPFRFEAVPSVVGRWDRSRLDQVLTNLLSNALKYGQGKEIEFLVETDGTRARIHVRDQGIGIAPENQQRIFERFERAVSSRQFVGLGLGLWISRQIVVALGGDIHVVSELGRGSTFTVELPILSSES